MAKNLGVTSHVTPLDNINPRVLAFHMDTAGLVTEGEFTGAIPTDIDVYQIGCKLVKTDAPNGMSATYINEGTAAAPSFALQNSGWTLLGKLIGLNLNVTPVAQVKYSGATGTVLTAGDTITGGTSLVTATVIANDVASGTLSVTTPSGTWTNGETITGTYTTINYSAIVGGPFQVGETVTDGTRTATVVAVTTTHLIVSSSTGTFSGTITGGTSLASATVDSYVGVPSATLVSNSPSTDQLVTLSGGSLFIITDFVITNASVSLNTAADLKAFTGPSRSGVQVGSDNGHLSTLTTASKYIDVTGSNNTSVAANNDVASTNTLYLSLGTAQGAPATADVYFYGYILA